MNEANKCQGSAATSESSKQSKSAVESEFVSDAFQTTDKDLDEVKAGMKLLGIDSLASQSKKNDGKTILANSQELQRSQWINLQDGIDERWCAR